MITKRCTRSASRALIELFAATHAGMTRRRSSTLSRATGSARRSIRSSGGSSPECIYQPQVELLDYLRAERLQDLHRVRRRHRPHPRVCRGRLRHSARAGDRLEREAALRDAGRPAGADEARRAQQLRRPRGQAAEHRPAHRTAADSGFGNSDGDLAMLRYTKTGPGRAPGALLHHDDAEREFAYDRDSG